MLSAYSLMQRSNDTAASFEQEANFWYLTGINDPNWWVIIDGSSDKSWLVAPNIDEVHRVFEGGITSEQAKKISGIDSVIAQKEAETLLRELARKHSVIHALGDDPHREFFNFVENPAQKKLWHVLDRIFNSVQDCRLDIAKLRAIKQPEEIKAMRKAIRLTTDAFEVVKGKLPGFAYEHEVRAEFDYYFTRHGASNAFESVVASGKNACTIHHEGSSKLKKGTMMLMDIGARVDGYSADICRTYALGGLSKRQKSVYEAIERCHYEIINLLRPGVAVKEYMEKTDEIMKQALISLGLFDTVDDEKYRTYFPHAISHGLGIDPHDSLGQPQYFEAGMVLTVEPGIYILDEAIGARIEDDILITKTGHENLSRHLSTGL